MLGVSYSSYVLVCYRTRVMLITSHELRVVLEAQTGPPPRTPSDPSAGRRASGATSRLEANGL